MGEFLALAVPGLAEGRPSLLPGDRLVLSEPSDLEGGPEYEGYIHEVYRSRGFWCLGSGIGFDFKMFKCTYSQHNMVTFYYNYFKLFIIALKYIITN